MATNDNKRDTGNDRMQKELVKEVASIFECNKEVVEQAIQEVQIKKTKITALEPLEINKLCSKIVNILKCRDIKEKYKDVSKYLISQLADNPSENQLEEAVHKLKSHRIISTPHELRFWLDNVAAQASQNT